MLMGDSVTFSKPTANPITICRGQVITLGSEDFFWPRNRLLSSVSTPLVEANDGGEKGGAEWSDAQAMEKFKERMRLLAEFNEASHSRPTFQ